MSSSGPTIQQTEAVGLAICITATVITLFRLGERIRQRRLWLDDAWAALALVLNIVFFVTSYLNLSRYTEYSQAENIAMYYVILEFFCATVWASRTSILFTIVRLTNPSSGLRRTLMCIFAAFLITWAILFAQGFWVCESEPGWKSDPRPQCDLGRSVAIAQIITDVIADGLLIIIPTQLVYKVRLTRPQKIRIISIFSASAITTVVCLVHAYYVFINGGLKVCVAAYFEASVSSTVANSGVVTAFLFRIGTEETAAFSPKDLGSIVTIGSLPVLRRVRRDPDYLTTVVGVETTLGALDNLGRIPSANKEDSESSSDIESHKPSQLDILPNV